MLLVVLLAIGPATAGDDIDEAALFSDTNTVIDSAKIVNTLKGDTANFPKKTVGFSGQVVSAGVAAATREFFSDPQSDRIGFAGSMVGNLMLDIRLISGVKAFANLEAGYAASLSQMQVNLREIFVDANIAHRVYLRTGKQVLQWGPCNFWNPTDLINVEKKLFIQKIGYREGAYGLKLHVPFGTLANVYGFLDAKDVSSIDSLAGAAKVEFLLGGTEFAFSGWGKQDREPVFGFDVTTGIWDFNVAGELSLSYGNNASSLHEENGVLGLHREDDKLITHACLGLTRWFDLLNMSDRLMVIGELYYNSAGYSKNAFADPDTAYRYSEPLNAISATGMPTVKTSGTKTDFLVGHGLYERNSYSHYYLALFTSISRFINTSMTLNLNAIGNLEQQCAMLSAGLTYTSLSDFSLGVTVAGNVGKKNTEYTFKSPENPALMLQLTAGMAF
jgi:hypothetical protein